MTRATRRALVVDDDETVRFVVAEALKRAGWAVVEVSDGVQVEERLEMERYDAVLLDLYMPGMNGYEVLRRVRHHSASMQPAWQTRPDVRIVVLSGEAVGRGFAFARKLGADACLAKPFDLDDLMDAVGG